MRVCRPKRENDELIDHDACGVGFIAQIGSEGTRDVVERALNRAGAPSHRGGVDSDGSSGDGAGLLTPIPKQFIRKRLQELGVALPEVFGMGMTFMPQGRAGGIARGGGSCGASDGVALPGLASGAHERVAVGPGFAGFAAGHRAVLFRLG